MEYDLIGDVHGQGDRLERILSVLGYVQTPTGFRNPDRTALFLGDLIDRGNQNRQVLRTVRDMVENGSARVILGNHEFNAIGFHQNDPDSGLPLRPHSGKNIRQHRSFLAEFPPGDPDTKSVIDWFKTLPLFMELDGFRLVHACWDKDSIEFLSQNLNADNVLSDPALQNAYKPHTDEFKAVERLLKGPEISLPDGFLVNDKANEPRREIRVKWWKHEGPKTYRSLAFSRPEVLDKIPDLEADGIELPVQYDHQDVPVFFGHYSLDPASQHPVQADNVICLDFSGPKDPPITTYTWIDGDGFSDARLTQV